MSDEIKKDRSPNCPKQPLARAVDMVKTLYSKAGKTKVKPLVAANAIGYGSINGAALTALGVLSQYGLTDRDDSGNVFVSPDAIALLHPKDDVQKISILRKMALCPKVFKELFTGGFHKCDEELLSNHLIQNHFNPDAAKKVASVFKANVELAKLDEDGLELRSESEEAVKNTDEQPRTLTGLPPYGKGGKPETLAPPPQKPALQGKLLATYSIPIGSSEATLTFTGDSLSTQDFDALIEYVQLFKKQYERKMKAIQDNNVVENITAFMAEPKS